MRCFEALGVANGTMSSTLLVASGRSQCSMGVTRRYLSLRPGSGPLTILEECPDLYVSGAWSLGGILVTAFSGQLFLQARCSTGRELLWGEERVGTLEADRCGSGRPGEETTPLRASLSPAVVQRSQVLRQRRNRVMWPAGAKSVEAQGHR